MPPSLPALLVEEPHAVNEVRGVVVEFAPKLPVPLYVNKGEVDAVPPLIMVPVIEAVKQAVVDRLGNIRVGEMVALGVRLGKRDEEGREVGVSPPLLGVDWAPLELGLREKEGEGDSVVEVLGERVKEIVLDAVGLMVGERVLKVDTLGDRVVEREAHCVGDAEGQWERVAPIGVPLCSIDKVALPLNDTLREGVREEVTDGVVVKEGEREEVWVTEEVLVPTPPTFPGVLDGVGVEH